MMNFIISTVSVALGMSIVVGISMFLITRKPVMKKYLKWTIRISEEIQEYIYEED